MALPLLLAEDGAAILLKLLESVRANLRSCRRFAFGGISYADAVRKIRTNEAGTGGGNKQQGGARQQGAKQPQQQDKSKKRGGGCYVVCPTQNCKGYAYIAQMAGDAVTCTICNALYPREWLYPEQQRHLGLHR